MSAIRFSDALASEYQRLYDQCEIRPNRFKMVDKVVDGILADQERYESVGKALSIPWFLIAAIHNLESSRRFTRHLHNGDPLSDRTRQVPAGRPHAGNPPFTWEESAEDALKLHGLHRIEDWTLPRLLYEMERYNGWGYRSHHPHVLSPYLWSYSNHYSRGKYVADGRWSDTAISNQSGGVVVIRRLEERHQINTTETGLRRTPDLRFSTKIQPRADDLQRFLNTFPGILLRVDGIAATKTSDAVEKIFGFYLDNDPRNKTDGQ